VTLARLILGCTAALLLTAGRLAADELVIAAATNFSGAARAIAARFEEQTGHRALLVFGSSGKLYAQIRNGAPFDVFFSADATRPELLERQGMAVPGSRMTYAEGRLVLWSARENYVDPRGRVLHSGDFRFVAMANPKLAPYGRAAEQVLHGLRLWDTLQGRIVRGENIGQAFQFVMSGNAALGFVARSQLGNPDVSIGGSLWEVPHSLYDPIEQQLVLLKDNAATRALLSYIKSDEVRELIRRYGYETP